MVFRFSVEGILGVELGLYLNLTVVENAAR